MFSECSRRSIGAVLTSKGGCFEIPPSICGDYQVDDDTEQCDAGPEGDNCCTSDCSLRNPVVCR